MTLVCIFCFSFSDQYKDTLPYSWDFACSHMETSMWRKKHMCFRLTCESSYMCKLTQPKCLTYLFGIVWNSWRKRIWGSCLSYSTRNYKYIHLFSRGKVLILLGLMQPLTPLLCSPYSVCPSSCAVSVENIRWLESVTTSFLSHFLSQLRVIKSSCCPFVEHMVPSEMTGDLLGPGWDWNQIDDIRTVQTRSLLHNIITVNQIRWSTLHTLHPS